MAIRALLVDDEEPARDRLRGLLGGIDDVMGAGVDHHLAHRPEGSAAKRIDCWTYCTPKAEPSGPIIG